jgi:hypothetical protein
MRLAARTASGSLPPTFSTANPIFAPAKPPTEVIRLSIRAETDEGLPAASW